MAHATLVIETAWSLSNGALPAVRVIPHKDDGSKPRGKAGEGVLIVARDKDETHAELLRTCAAYLEQEGSWAAFAKDRMLQRGDAT